MEFLMSGEVGRVVFATGTVGVLLTLWFGYHRNIFNTYFSWLLIDSVVGYMIIFLSYRYVTAHITEHMSHQPYYALLASVHGTVSLIAVILACYMFVKARPAYKGGENYFKTHIALTSVLSLLWPLALISGLLV